MGMQTTTHPTRGGRHERAARAEKVAHLVATLVLASPETTAAEVARWASEPWLRLTDAANELHGARHAPPSAATRELVVEALRRAELARAS